MASLPFALAVALSGFVAQGWVVFGGHVSIREPGVPLWIRDPVPPSLRVPSATPYIRVPGDVTIRGPVVPPYIRSQ